jgi:hypothetical protein
MAIAINPDDERVYILKEDRALPKDEQTLFFLRTLTARDYYRLKDGAMEVRAPIRNAMETRTVFHSGTQEQEIMLKGLIRWENLKDGHGNVLSYPDGNDSNAKLKAMSYLRPNWRKEISEVILADSDVTEQDEGNFASQPGSPQVGTAHAAESQTDATAD